jgi:hypothetical protein
MLKQMVHIVVCTAVSRQLLCKHVTAATNTHAIIEVLLETVFFLLCRSKWIIRRATEARTDSWKGTAVERRLRPEAEESPLLEAVTRQLLVKTLRDVKDSA